MEERNEDQSPNPGGSQAEEQKPADQQPSDQGDGAAEPASVDEPAVVGE